MIKTIKILLLFASLFLLTQCKITPGTDTFLARWQPSNCGNAPYGSLYSFNYPPQCPIGYSLPSRDDFYTLEQYPGVWGMGTGDVYGYWVCPKNNTDALESPSIDKGCLFFPAAGYKVIYDTEEEYVEGKDTMFGCWSTTSEDDGAYFFGGSQTNEVGVYWQYWSGEDTQGRNWKYTMSVRCIKK